jgi:hypothetical protein
VEEQDVVDAGMGRAYNSGSPGRGMKVKAKFIHPDKLACPKKIKPGKKGPSFCYRLRKSKDPKDVLAEPLFKAEFYSTRTGKLLGFLAPANGVTQDPDKALSWDNPNEFAGKWELQRFLVEGQRGGKYKLEKFAKKTLKALEKAAED